MINDLIVLEKKTDKTQNNVKPKIIYGYDALCGWCYGFSEELNKAVRALNKEVDFELVSSGLFAEDIKIKMKFMSGHIKRNMQSVTDRTGMEFGNGFQELLNNDEYPYNSMKASIAIEVIKDLMPEKVFDFAGKIQKAFFYDGDDIQCEKTYLKLIRDYDIDKEQFLRNFYCKSYEEKAQNLFSRTREYDFNGYPASALKTKGKVKVLVEGFVTADQFVSLIRKELSA